MPRCPHLENLDFPGHLYGLWCFPEWYDLSDTIGVDDYRGLFRMLTALDHL